MVSEMISQVQPVATLVATGTGVYVAVGGLNAWRRQLIGKRNIELCQTVIEKFYEAEQRVEILRSPLAFPIEARDRPKEDEEAPADRHRRDTLYVPIARYLKQADFWADFFSYRFRMKAMFGEVGELPFVQVDQCIRRFRAAAETRYNYLQGGSSLPADTQRRFEAVIWAGGGDPEMADEIRQTLLDAVAEMERLCVPIVRPRSFGEEVVRRLGWLRAKPSGLL